jgi:poly-gamma-glutamate synthesis protein (capsule biosynthesis protein)
MAIDLNAGSIVLEQNPGKAFDILFVGDLCPRNHTEPIILAGKSREILAEVMPELARKDLSIVNLETPLTRAETPIWKSGPNLKVDPGCIEIVKAGKWDIACCANNHIGDFGPAPAVETMDILRKNNIGYVGVGKNLPDARKPLFIEKNGLKIAIIAVAENEFGIAKEGEAGANPLQPVRNIGQISEVSKISDITLVLIHGGNEFNPVPSPRVVETYRAFAEAGATAVVAGHTHCLQGIEIWQGVPIIYSLSNFLFDITSPENPYKGYNWWYGFMVRIGFSANKAVKLEVIPHHCAPNAESVKLLKGEERKKCLAFLTHLSNIIPDEKLVKKYYEAWCVRGIEGYFARLGAPFYPADWNDADSIRKLMAMRNLHTCEAHCELITTTLRIAEERREEEAREYLPKLEKLCAGEMVC